MINPVEAPGIFKNATQRGAKLGWGLVDQIASSATNLLLTLVTARLLGAQALGVVTVGFTFYLLLLGQQRNLLSQPLVVATAAAPFDRQIDSSRSAVTLSMLVGVASTGVMATIGIIVGGTFGHTLLLFAPWIVPALLQDMWRTLLFRDSRGGAATLNDLIWLITMIPALIGSWYVATDWSVVGAWGLGASTAALLGFLQMNLWPRRIAPAFSLWRQDLWPLGRWLAGASVFYVATSQAIVLVIGAVLGTAALGGLRAVQTLFAPLSLLLPAIALPGLPLMTRRLAVSPSRAVRLALQLNGLLVVVTCLYCAALIGFGGDDLLSRLFGASFGSYQYLILPVIIAQIIAGFGVGFDLLLTARGLGSRILALRATTGMVSVMLVTLSALLSGLLAVAWSLVASAVFLTATAMVLALGRTERPRLTT